MSESSYMATGLKDKFIAHKKIEKYDGKNAFL